VAIASASAVRKHIAAGTLDPIYLLQGEDDIEKTVLALEFVGAVDEGLRAFNVDRAHAGEWTTGDRIADGVQGLLAAARTLPMMAPRRIVVVQQAEHLAAPKRESEAATKALAAFEAYLEHPEVLTALVLVAAPLDKRSRLYKVLLKCATIVECGVIEDQGDAERWVRARVSAAGAVLEPAAAQLLAARAGADLARLRGEVDRLLLYALGQKTITIDDARQVAGPASLLDPWALTNAIEQGAAPEALRQLALACDAGAAPEQVLGQVAWVVRAKFPAAALGSAVEAVFRTDLDLKRSNRSSDQPRMLLERLIVELCGKRPAALRR
jgi:DNA polymerase III subunit delta